jgi:hypothetical protein
MPPALPPQARIKLHVTHPSLPRHPSSFRKSFNVHTWPQPPSHALPTTHQTSRDVNFRPPTHFNGYEPPSCPSTAGVAASPTNKMKTWSICCAAQPSRLVLCKPLPSAGRVHSRKRRIVSHRGPTRAGKRTGAKPILLQVPGASAPWPSWGSRTARRGATQKKIREVPEQ